MHPGVARIIDAIYRTLEPPENLDILECAEKYYYLSPDHNNPIPGLIRFDLTPYLKAIAEALIIGNGIDEVTFVKACQIGGTTITNSLLLWVVLVHPTGALVVFPTEDNSERFVQTKFWPMLQECERVRQKIGTDKGKLTLYSFPGGSISFGNAHAANKLRMDSRQIVVLEELSDYPPESNSQGSPEIIARGRTNAYQDRSKIYKCSTPVDLEVCKITKSYLESDQRKYYVPCPECDFEQEILWEKIKWNEQNITEVWMECSKCGIRIKESSKQEMLLKGKWVATAEDKWGGRKVGFHISSLYAPSRMYSWRKAVQEYLEAKNDPGKLKVFYNNILGLAWDAKNTVSKNTLKKRISDYRYNPLPAQVGLITGGVDFNQGHTNIELVGWGADKQSWGLYYDQIDLPLTDPNVFRELDKKIDMEFVHPMGHRLIPYCVALDTGWEADTIYDYIRMRMGDNRVIGIKGSKGNGPIISTQPRYQNKGNIPLFRVARDTSLETLYSWLEVKKPGPAYCNFPKFYKDTKKHERKLNYFEQLKAFYRKPYYKKGVLHYEWDFSGRKEANDCRRYAMAALFHSLRLGADLNKWCDDIMSNTPEQMNEILMREEASGFY